MMALMMACHLIFPQIPPSTCTTSSFTCIYTTQKIHKPFLLLRCTYFSLTHFCLLCVHKIYCLFYYYYAQNIQAYNRRLLFNHECCLVIHYGEYVSKKSKSYVIVLPCTHWKSPTCHIHQSLPSH